MNYSFNNLPDAVKAMEAASTLGLDFTFERKQELVTVYHPVVPPLRQLRTVYKLRVEEASYVGQA